MSLSGCEANLNVWKRESVEIFLLAQNFNSFLSQGTNWLHPHTNTCKIIKTNKYFQKFFLLFRLRSLVSMPFLWPPYLCNISALSLFSLVISYLVAFFCFRSTGSWTQDVAEDLYAQNWGCGGSFAQASKKPPCNQIKGPSLVWWNSVENPKIHYWLVKTLKSFISEISPRLCLFSSQEVDDAKRLFLLSPKAAPHVRQTPSSTLLSPTNTFYCRRNYLFYFFKHFLHRSKYFSILKYKRHHVSNIHQV